jgi:hypothetical protein
MWHMTSSVLPATIGMASGHPGAGLATGVGGPLAFMGGAHAAASEPVQKLLYGDYDWQKYLADAIRNNPQTAYSAGMGARSAATGLEDQ